MDLNTVKNGLAGTFIGLAVSSLAGFKYKASVASLSYSVCELRLDTLKSIAKTVEPIKLPSGGEIHLGMEILVDASLKGDRAFVRDVLGLLENPSALDGRCQPLLEKMQDAEWQSTVATALTVTAAVIGVALITYLKRPAKNA